MDTTTHSKSRPRERPPTPPPERNSKLPRATVARLARAAKGGLIGVADASAILDVPRRTASLKLAALARKGWLARVRRGLYLVLPLEAEPGRPATPDDPWVVAREAFSPCYIGGWSAAEHWGLTEQIFRSTLVVTSANIRARSIELLGHEFRLFRVPRSRLGGTTLVWRRAERVPVSDRERTIVDCLRHPELCGGVRHLVDMLREYRSGEDYDATQLVKRAREAANGAAWKRLGYLVERLWRGDTAIIDEARAHMSAGTAKLDPGVRRRGSLVRRWGLWANVEVSEG